MLKKRSDKLPKKVCKQKLCCTHQDEKTNRERETDRQTDRYRERETEREIERHKDT